MESGNENEQYPPELRSFALTLHFYSLKAYDYVRETFDTCLPHPSTLQNGIAVSMEALDL